MSHTNWDEPVHIERLYDAYVGKLGWASSPISCILVEVRCTFLFLHYLRPRGPHIQSGWSSDMVTLSSVVLGIHVEANIRCQASDYPDIKEEAQMHCATQEGRGMSVRLA